MGLTVKRIAKLVNSKEAGRYGDGGGLYLQVPPRGEKMPRNKPSASWLFRYERDGKERWMGLGALNTFSLDEARERARKARQQLQDGIDPLEALRDVRAKRALDAAKALTFEQAARQYFDTHEKKWRSNKHRQQFLNTLVAYAFPKIGRLPVASIDTGLVLKVIEPHWQSKTVTMSRVRNRIESVLDWATVRGYRTGDNPARWKGHLSEALPAVIAKPKHHEALPFAELPEFFTTLRTRKGVGLAALEFLILTAARTGEVIGAKWDEFDLNGKVWTVPSGRIKGGREHRVPLSDRTLEILRSLPREDDNPFVFIGSKKRMGLSPTATHLILKSTGRDDITVHGFRSTFRDWASEKTAYPNHVIEMALAHAIGNKVEASYRRGDLFEKRKRLMADWAKYCLTPPAKTTGDVVSLHGAR
jgi:integrase